LAEVQQQTNKSRIGDFFGYETWLAMFQFFFTTFSEVEGKKGTSNRSTWEELLDVRKLTIFILKFNGRRCHCTV